MKSYTIHGIGAGEVGAEVQRTDIGVEKNT